MYHMLQPVGTCKGIKESKFKFEGKILHQMLFPYLFGKNKSRNDKDKRV